MLPSAFLRNSRKTESGAKQFLAALVERAAPFALLRIAFSATLSVGMVAAQSAQDPKAPAVLSGSVVSIGSSPIPNASITLLPLPSGRTNSSSADDRGRFTFAGVAPGRYALSASAKGFVRQNYRVPGNANDYVLTVDAGQELDGLDIKLTPNGSISGRVTDTDGKPVGGADVMLLRVNYAKGHKELAPQGLSVTTDSEGRYLLEDVVPGRLYVSAEDRSWSSGKKGDNEKPQGTRESFIATLYPSAVDLGTAVPVTVMGGAQSRGIDIRMRKEPMYSIRGKAIDSAAKPAASLPLMLSPKEQRVPSFTRNTIMTATDGTFEFADVPPGDYNVDTIGGKAGAPMGRVTVLVKRSDAEDALLRVGQGTELRGSLKFEDGAASKSPATVVLDPQDFFLGATAQSDASGSVVLTGVHPLRYTVRFSGAPEGAYVKSIRLGGQEVTDRVLDLSSGVTGTLDIVLSSKAASVSGVARNKEGAPIPGAYAQLWPKSGNLGTPPRTVACDGNGAFNIGGLPPGQYHVIAWEEIPEDGISLNPDFLARFTSDAATVKLDEGSRENVDVKTISRDRIVYESANVP